MQSTTVLYRPSTPADGALIRPAEGYFLPADITRLDEIHLTPVPPQDPAPRQTLLSAPDADSSVRIWSWFPPTALRKIVSAGNGILYFAIAKAGGENLRHFLGFDSMTALDVLSGFASLCNAMFYYKTLEYIKLKPTRLTTALLACLAPISASGFLAAGVEGSAQLTFLPREADIAIGVTLYILRMLACIDGSVKLPGRMEELRDAWEIAWAEKDYKELSRLIVTGLVSVGYALSCTDAIYEAAELILGWFGIGSDTASCAAYAAGALGALGLFPLILYWTHRGIKQLTHGGRSNDIGTNLDPTDRYTFFSLLPVAPVTLGIIGATSSTGGAMFGKLGWAAEIVRLFSSSVYSIAGGVPGMSTLLRGTAETLHPQTALTCYPCTKTAGPSEDPAYAQLQTHPGV